MYYTAPAMPHVPMGMQEFVNWVNEKALKRWQLIEYSSHWDTDRNEDVVTSCILGMP